MVLCAVIATTLGQGQAKPRLAFVLIFGVLAAFFVVLFVLQSADIGRAESGSVAPDVDPGEIQDPIAVDEPTLWASMAVKPIDAAARRARATLWAPARTSLHYGMLITLLIFLAVPPIYLFDTFVPLMIGAPLIVLTAIVASVRITMSGGQIEAGFDRMSDAMTPLGLAVTGRPKVELRQRGPAQPGFSAGLDGAIVLAGERHGRQVTITLPPLTGVKPKSLTNLAVPTPEFTLKARYQRLHAEEGASPAIEQVLMKLAPSERWTGVTAKGGPEGIAFERKGDSGGEWLLDLWLAERLADALGVGGQLTVNS
jgi:hypothetical protein